MQPPSRRSPKRKDYRVDLVGVGINARLPLRSCIALAVVWTANPDEVLGEDALVKCVETHVLREYTFALASSTI